MHLFLQVCAVSFVMTVHVVWFLYMKLQTPLGAPWVLASLLPACAIAVAIMRKCESSALRQSGAVRRLANMVGIGALGIALSILLGKAMVLAFST